MSELSATSPLAHRGGTLPAVWQSTDLRMTEQTLHVLSLRLSRSSAPSEIGARLGVALPALNSALAMRGGWVVGTEPKAWLIFSNVDVHCELGAILADIPATVGLVTDLSSQLSSIAISGTDATRVIASGCAVDLHASAFQTGSAASSRLSDVSVLIVKTAEEPAFLLSCERTFAVYVWDWLLQAASYS